MDKANVDNSGFSPFFESFVILCQMNNQIRWAIYPPSSVGEPTDFEGRRDFKGMDADLKMTICFHVLLLVSTFMEEFSRIEKLAISLKDKRLQTALETIEPATNRIKEWGKGLKIVRNQFLAHPLRDGSRHYVTPKGIMTDKSIPTNFVQMLILGKLANLVVQNLAVLYPYEAKLCWEWQESQDFKSEPRGINNIAEAEDELKKPKEK